MSTPPKVVVTVQSVMMSYPGKRVLLVEGVNDKDVYTAWLQKLAHPGLFSAKVVVESVGGRPAVLNALEWFRDYGGNPSNLFGLVDRDEWDATTLAAQSAALPQLRVVSERDCLESYFADPDELEPSLLAEAASYAPDLPAFRAFLVSHLDDRTDHWSLFMTTERTKERMNAAQYPGAFHATIPLPVDTDIEVRFQAWAGLVGHPNLFNEFTALRAHARSATQGLRFRSHLCAKRFFEDVVHPGPDGLQRFGVKTDRTWRIDLAQNAPVVPADIAAILQPLLV